MLLAAEGLRAVTLLAFGCYVAAIATTALLPEPRGRALDDVIDDLKSTSAATALARQRLSRAPLNA
jgi:Fe2+ transport system protein B